MGEDRTTREKGGQDARSGNGAGYGGDGDVSADGARPGQRISPGSVAKSGNGAMPGNVSTSSNGAISSNIAEILRERDRLERILREKFEKEVVILFTDICGYTEHTDLHGDVSGLTLIQRHNQIVLPIIARHKGMVIKTIGDAVMASFSNPLEAVKASVAIQNSLHEYNSGVEVSDKIHYNSGVDASAQIHIKIGINIGQALVDKADIHGDVVNVASRIQAQAGPDQILISSGVYEQVRGIEDILCRSHETVQVKGKAEPLELYRVVWQDEDIVLSIDPKVRAYGGASQGEAGNRLRVIQLEVTRQDRQDTRLKIIAHERISGEESALSNYEEIPVSMDWIQTRCHEMVETLNAVNRQGRFSREVLVKLRETGGVFYNELLPASIKAKLKETRAEYLKLNIDDQLVQVPWELLYDGQQFLCQRFNMGRLVKTRQPVQGIKARVLASPLRMLIIADPAGDLKDASKEGTQIREYLARYGSFINVSLRSQDITPAFIKEKMRYFDLVHFAGHADYDQKNPEKSGWRLTRGSLTAQDVFKMAGSSTMPALIFSNSCQSARTGEWTLKEHFQDEIFGLAHAFLLSGVRHYVGTFWEILDEPGGHFALEFYKRLLSGLTTGEAVREARLSLVRKYGEETALWASYILYGDPTSNYLDQINQLNRLNQTNTAEAEKSGNGDSYCLDAPDRTDKTDHASKTDHAKTAARWWLSAGGLGLLLFILFMAAYFSFFNQGFFNRGSQKSPPLLLPEVLSSSGHSADSDFQRTVQIIHLLSNYQNQLASRFKERGFGGKEADTWTSAPVSIGMILPDWDRIDYDTTEAVKPAVGLRPHFEALFKRMIENFSRTHALGLSILERERLEAILQELQIGISDLSSDTLKDAHTILSARVILFPEPVFYRFDQEKESQEVSLRLVETKTTRIIAAFSRTFAPQTESINKAVSELVEETVRTLQEQYPLRGRIVSLDDKSVEINLGSTVGLFEGQPFYVLGQMENKPPKGIILVKSVYEHTALAKILERGQESKKFNESNEANESKEINKSDGSNESDRFNESHGSNGFKVGDRIKAVAYDQRPAVSGGDFR